MTDDDGIAGAIAPRTPGFASSTTSNVSIGQPCARTRPHVLLQAAVMTSEDPPVDSTSATRENSLSPAPREEEVQVSDWSSMAVLAAAASAAAEEAAIDSQADFDVFGDALPVDSSGADTLEHTGESWNELTVVDGNDGEHGTLSSGSPVVDPALDRHGAKRKGTTASKKSAKKQKNKATAGLKARASTKLPPPLHSPRQKRTRHVAAKAQDNEEYASPRIPRLLILMCWLPLGSIDFTPNRAGRRDRVLAET